MCAIMDMNNTRIIAGIQRTITITAIGAYNRERERERVRERDKS
jgi:hypothetical protein